MTDLDWALWDAAFDHALRERDQAREMLAASPIFPQPNIEDADVRRFLHYAALSFGDQPEANMTADELFALARRWFGDRRVLDVHLWVH